jgi:hypothetical protein
MTGDSIKSEFIGVMVVVDAAVGVVVVAESAVVVTPLSGTFSRDSTRPDASSGLAPSVELLLQPAIRHSATHAARKASLLIPSTLTDCLDRP